jgi:hypothetical protein
MPRRAPFALVAASLWATALCAAWPCVTSLLAQEANKEFSGPQLGERVTPFKIRGVIDEQAGKEIDLVEAAGGRPLLLVFVHERNRPALGLARVVCDYAATKKTDGMSGGLIFLTPDATGVADWIKVATAALPKGVTIGIAEGGAEGPGAYGLNRKVQLTVLVAKDNKVTANFALVQPSVQADAPKIIEALAAAVGAKPPTAEELQRITAPMRRPK